MGSVIWKGSTVLLYEQPDSPKFDIGEKYTFTQIYKGYYSLALSSALPRGALGSGITAGMRVGTCKVEKERGGVGVLTIVWEANGVSSGAGLPPDEYDVDPFEINPKLEKNKYFDALDGDMVDRVRAAFAAQSVEARIAAMQDTDPAIAYQLLAKMRRGTESFYMAGFTYKWTLYFWSAPSLTAGGYIQGPGGPLSSVLAATDISLTFLRMADALHFTGQFFRLTRTWTGAPNAGGTTYWDPDIYNF